MLNPQLALDSSMANLGSKKMEAGSWKLDDEKDEK